MIFPEHGVSSVLLARMCELSGSREDRKKNGVFYTPFSLAHRIAVHAVQSMRLRSMDIPSLRILDPACGCGNFLLALLTFLHKKYHVLPDSRNVCGIELDAAAAQISELRIREFYLAKAGIKAHPQIVNADALCDSTLPEHSFDIIAGNPPFVQICDIPRKKRIELRNNYHFAIGRFNLFELFIEAGGRWLKPGGVCGWLVPDRILHNIQSASLRAWMESHWTTISIQPMPDGFFPDAVVNYISCILRNTPPKQHRPSQKDLPFTEIMRRHSVPLGSIAEIRDGIIQGAVGAELFLNVPVNKFCKPLLTGSDIRRGIILSCRHWVRYQPDEMRSLELSRVSGKSIGLRMRKPEIFERPKILTRQTADSIIAAFDPTGLYYYNNTLHGTHITSPDYQAEFILAVLNSQIMTRYYRTITGECGKIFAQIKIAVLRNLPICHANKQQQQEVLSATDADIREKIICKLYGLPDIPAL